MSIDVSVVIPTYKRPAYLFRCLMALARQSFPLDRFEIIVVTDGPDSSTTPILQGSSGDGPSFRLCSLETKKGPAAARNAGWCRAFGELILFTDDDCVPDPQWISRLWRAYDSFRSQTPLGWVLGEALAFRGAISVPYPPRPTDHEKNTAGLQTASFVTANCACTWAALEKIGGFDETFSMAWREDSDLEFKLLEQGIPIIFVPEALVTHPARQANWGISLKEQKKSLFNALLYKKHPMLFRQKIYSRPFWNYYAMIGLLLTALIGTLVRQPVVAGIALAGWLILTGIFILRRLSGTSHTPRHIMEMMVTSIFIPFLSVFWTLYGAIRFKTFFL